MSLSRARSRRARGLAATGTASVLLVALAPGLPSFAAAVPPSPGAQVDIQGEERGHRDVERRGDVAPTDA